MCFKIFLLRTEWMYCKFSLVLFYIEEAYKSLEEVFSHVHTLIFLIYDVYLVLNRVLLAVEQRKIDKLYILILKKLLLRLTKIPQTLERIGIVGSFLN
jgi:hypothetical protein